MRIEDLKKRLSRLLHRRKSGYTNFSSDLNIRGAAAESGRTRRPSALSRLRQRLRAKKLEQSQGYGRPKARHRSLAGPLAVVAVVVLLPAAWYFGGGEVLGRHLDGLSFFRVNKIEVSGCTAVPRDKVVEASGIVLRQSSMLAVDLEESRKRIAAIPWVARAEVRRHWPGKIAIAIEENAPVALVHIPGGSGPSLRYLDANGTVFSEATAKGDIDFPVITGWAELGDEEVKARAMTEILAFLRKVRGNDPHLPAHSVSELHITGSGEMVLYLVEYPFPIFFGNGNSKGKYSRLIQVLRALYKKPDGKELLAQIAYIKMDYLSDKVLVVESAAGQKSNG